MSMLVGFAGFAFGFLDSRATGLCTSIDNEAFIRDEYMRMSQPSSVRFVFCRTTSLSVALLHFIICLNSED